MNLIILERSWKLWIRIILLNILVNDINAEGITNRNSEQISSQSSTNSCILPPHPSFGRWNIFQTSSSLTSDGSVSVGTILEINCNDKYKLDGGQIIACIRGEWKPGIGQCLRTCVSLRSTSSTIVTCTYEGVTLKTCNNAFHGTRVRFQCAPFYEIRGLNRFPVRICSNGRWNGGVPECVPVCGKKAITKDPALIVGGSNTTSLEYPWQVALYENTTKTLICGGTLLNEKTIVTAAHCVTTTTGKLESKELYIVAVGKTYRGYDDPRDKTTQFSSIQAMYIPRQYKGHIQRYFGDIAIIIANKTFVLSLNVLPICVVWEKDFHQSLERPRKVNRSYVSGWGFTAESKNPSDVLKTLQVPLISNDECERRLSEDDLEYLTDDKLCAGFLESGMSVCKGDSGGGLVSKYGDRYYIIAVVSIAPRASTAVGGCNSQQYSLYTKFSYYLEDFIIDIEAQFRPYEHVTFVAPTTVAITHRGIGCLLPDHPKFGNWSVVYGLPSHKFVTGMLVAPGTVLKIECQSNYTLSGDSSLVCGDEQWSSSVGQCWVLDAALKIDTKTYKPEVQGLVGDSITLKCAITGKPTPEITWKKDNLGIDGTQAKYRINLDQSLQISPLRKTDAGIYFCTANNSIVEPVTNQIKLDVIDGPPGPASILEPVAQPDVVVSLNAPATLYCSALGYPLPAVTWWKDDNIMPIKTSQLEVRKDYSLFMYSVKLSNLGVYTCQAYNGIGKAVKSSVTLKAIGPYHSANPNDRKYLKYIVNCPPKDHQLTILNATTRDSGVYRCEAANAHSTASSSGTILVDGTYFHPNCTDNDHFANCGLIVKAKFCQHRYYANFCCKSCIEAGLLKLNGSQLLYAKGTTWVKVYDL